jgi:hypothetical protein
LGNTINGIHSFPAGFAVKINATADTGYQFSYWTGASGSASTTIIMDGSKTIGANFTEIPAVEGVKYVWKGAKGTSNGSSWINAYIDLNTALKQVTSGGTEIWVARGEYFRESGPTSYFSPSVGIKLYGGCSGYEKSISERNARLFNENTTILNGAAMDALVYINAVGVLLDGFVLTNAQYGAYVDGSGNAVIENCVLRNFSESAAYFSGACESPIIRKSVFHTNKKASGTDYTTGKAIHIGETVTNALIENCIIVNNDGPAISDDRNITTNLTTIKNCTVVYNAN